MSTKSGYDPANSARSGQQALAEAETGGARLKARSTTAPQLTSVDIVADGKTAVTRPSVPPVFRFLLALTGVRV
jgi:hypothetical protein